MKGPVLKGLLHKPSPAYIRDGTDGCRYLTPTQEEYLQPLRNPMNSSAREHSLRQMNMETVKNDWQTVRSHIQSLEFTWGLMLDGVVASGHQLSVGELGK